MSLLSDGTIDSPCDGGGGTESVEISRQHSILLVDDEEVIIKALRRIIGRRVSVDTAASGDEAIQKMEDGIDPDYIFCDITMPNGTGRDVYEYLRANKPELVDRIKFVSGGATNTKGERGGLGDFYNEMKRMGKLVEKPFDIQEIRLLIANALLGVE